MAELYKSLCLELDLLLIDIIDDMEKHIMDKLDLEKSMNEGFVNIAKTRYINGRSSVTSLQLPTEFSNPLQPQARIKRSQDSIEVENSLAVGNKLGSEKEKVRKRGKEETHDEKITDPIRLFGVLVPQALKTAQKHFITSVEKVGGVAQSEMALDKKLLRFSKLMEMKKQLTS